MEQEQRGPQETEGREFKPVMVRNADIPLLADVLYIMQDVAMIEERRAWQQDRMTNITQHLTGMPGGGGVPHGLEDAFSLLSELDTEHEEQCAEYVKQLRQAQKILNGIQSQGLRTFVKLKYVFDVPDTEIRERLNMTRRGFEKARRAVEDAPTMRAVRWKEKYVLIGGGRDGV